MSTASEHLAPADGGTLSVDEFAHLAGVEPQDVRDLLGYQLLAADRLDVRTALSLREAARQRAAFDLDLFTTGLVAGYIREVAELQDRLRQLQAERPAASTYTEVSFTSVQVRVN